MQYVYTVIVTIRNTSNLQAYKLEFYKALNHNILAQYVTYAPRDLYGCFLSDGRLSTSSSNSLYSILMNAQASGLLLRQSLDASSAGVLEATLQVTSPSVVQSSAHPQERTCLSSTGTFRLLGNVLNLLLLNKGVRPLTSFTPFLQHTQRQ